MIRLDSSLISTSFISHTLQYKLKWHIIDFIIFGMQKNSNQKPNDMEMSIYTFTHDYYMLQLPPVDHHRFYQSFPIYQDTLNYKGEQIRIAPIVRIYGTNETNEKCCCHVHGYFPFLYIKAEQFQQALKDPEFLLSFLLKLETVYQQAFQTDKSIIIKAQLQYKFDFYGYHTEKQAFLKIYLFDPGFVVNMRELLNSKIIGDKSFQCYEAHINYYMQFFSDFNIYGINEMKICGFTFRKNLKIMPLFQKISSNLNEGIVHRGWNLQYLEEKRPECFNQLYKMSSCYIEIDFDFHSILNAYEIVQSEEQAEFQSSDQQLLEKTEGMRKIKVHVTKALEEIWRDQKKRRSRFNIKKPLQGLIDLSRNVQSTPEVQQGLKDSMWINFMNKGQNGHQFITMLQSYLSSRQLSQQKQLKIDFQTCSSYKQLLAKQRQQLIEKVRSRFDYYEHRKNKIISEIKSGDRGELPQWSDDQSDRSQRSSQNSQASEESLEGGNFDYGHKKIEQPKQYAIESLGNTVKYRNNFKFQMANFKKDSLFSNCRFCRQKKYYCKCDLCILCGEESCFCNARDPNIQQQEEKQANPSQTGVLQQFQYCREPPSLNVVEQNVKVEHEKPYYSKIQDLYQHYKIGSSLPANHATSQLIDKQLKNTTFFNRQPPTIKNSKKLPYFYQYSKPKEEQPISMATYQLQYTAAPPTFAQVDRNCPKKRPHLNVTRPSSNKYQDTFVSDLVVLNYELLVEIEEPRLYYGDPEKHPIFGIVFQIYNQKAPLQSIRAAIITEKFSKNVKDSFLFDDIMIVDNQSGLLSLFISIVFRVDIDLFMSWDMEQKGLRYLLQRGIQNGINMAACLSRVNDLEDLFQHINFTQFKSLKQTFLKREYLIFGNVKDLVSQKPTKDNKHYLNILNQKLKKKLQKKPILRQKYKFDMQIKGRININLSRLCESLKLISYSLQFVVQHIFHTQISQFTDKYLYQNAHQNPESTLEYLLKRIQYQKLITHQMNIIGGIVEKSKVYGADFLSMMERGSQFKIESIMCRSAKQHQYLTLSATKVQVANQSLLECRPLVIEPPKQFYTEPVLLFDFQSLYPSVMIAYNLCYSTCLGSIKQLFKEGKRKKLGVNEAMTLSLDRICQLIQTKQQPEELIDNLAHNILITPNKVAFARKNLKEGFIPKILLEFLISRIMIKDSIKLYHRDSIKNLLKERQIALKMFMNVLFGYTGATFSGRMPCSEIADSVVEISKYCLRKSIDYLNNHPIYKGKVLYGDTDSIFFHLPNYKIGDTFQIGKILASQITKLFPYPMEMKFEKVYQSLFLVSKKRYYGKSYQNSQSQPKYQGKGVETVRRDGIPFTSMVMEKILNEMIDSKDLSKMKKLLLEESRKLLKGTVNLKELCLAKEVKMLKYSPKYLPAHAEAAKRLENIDPMMVPKYGQRLKYVIVEGVGPLKNRAIPLFQYMLKKEKYRLDLDYYYNHLFLPPLRRALISLVNLDEWGTVNQYLRSKNTKETSQHMHKTKKGEVICQQCLKEELNSIQSNCQSSELICRQCVGQKGLNFQGCVQWNCPNLYRRKKAREQWNTARQRNEQIQMILKIIGG